MAKLRLIIRKTHYLTTKKKKDDRKPVPMDYERLYTLHCFCGKGIHQIKAQWTRECAD